MTAAITPDAAFAGLPRLETPEAIPCKICDGPSPLLGVVDFHKSCEEGRGKRLNLSGRPVYYRQCQRCGFAFTASFDRWKNADFQHWIYNDDYLLVDPDYVETRPAAHARLVMESFPEARGKIRMLDYGGGAGHLARRLREEGFDAATYDPFSEFSALPSGKFHLITCFEVMEHVPWPRETAGRMADLLAEEGAILFSTLLQPPDFARTGMGWWYAAPRNGHISLYTTASLAWLYRPLGMKVAFFNTVLHMAYARVPEYARHLRLPE